MSETSYVTMSNLLAIKGGTDTGYMAGHRMPVNSDGMPGLNCKQMAGFELQPVELRIQADNDSLRASIRLPEGTLRTPLLCAPSSGTVGTNAAGSFEELQLDLAPDGEAHLFGLPRFGEDRRSLSWYDTTWSSDHDATISQCFGFATARLVHKIEANTSGPPLEDSVELSPDEAAGAIQSATAEIVDNLHDSAPYLYNLADQLVDRASEWDGLIGEDSGGRITTLFVRRVLRAAGFSGMTFFVDTSKESLARHTETEFQDYFRYIAAQISDDAQTSALLITESVFTGDAYIAVEALSNGSFDTIDYATVTNSTITPAWIQEKVLSGASVKPGTVSQFIAFEGVPLPQSLLSKLVGKALPDDITSIARPIGANGYRYYPDTSIVAGVTRSEHQRAPITRALTNNGDPRIDTALRDGQRAVRHATRELADAYIALRT